MPKKVIIKIHELLWKRNMTLSDLSSSSNVRLAALSELANQKRENINFKHLEKIATALNIDDISEIMQLIDDPEEQ